MRSKTLPIWRTDKPLFLKKGDKNYAKSVKQLTKTDFSDTELYGLDYTIAAFVLPRLKRFKEVNNGFPSALTSKSWDEILAKMILAFEINLQEEITEEEGLKRQEGFELFGKFLVQLWW